MDRSELEALQASGEERIFTARWERLGEPYSEGCRGTVESLGSPNAPHIVWVRDITGNRHSWDMRHLSVH
ncbi:hypothetical protein ACPXCO_24200 [Streptomyces cyaneofuscatus]|uniref:hypothetical protein n=1 Tax=Streptomyces cyaneofuscatus TaxID=66883 RepID=UPI003CEE3B52